MPVNQRSNRDPCSISMSAPSRSAVIGHAKQPLPRVRFSRSRISTCSAIRSSGRSGSVETAIVCELLVRGAQTPGGAFAGAARGRAVSRRQRSRDGTRGAPPAEGACVVRMARELGRVNRISPLFGGDIPQETEAHAAGRLHRYWPRKDGRRWFVLGASTRLEAAVESPQHNCAQRPPISTRLRSTTDSKLASARNAADSRAQRVLAAELMSACPRRAA